MQTIMFRRGVRGLAADPLPSMGGASSGAPGAVTVDIPNSPATSPIQAIGGGGGGTAACPCRTEKTTKNVTVVVPVTQTRVICDTPAPKTDPVDCATMQAAVQQATAGMQGMQGLADDGASSTLLNTVLIVGIGVLIGKYVL